VKLTKKMRVLLAAGPLLLVLGAAEARAKAAVSTTPSGPVINPNPGEDIRDIHGPIAIPRATPAWWYVAGAGAVAALAGTLVAASRRKRRPLPPYVRALQALARQRALAGGNARDFSVAVSETLRGYLEEAFSIRAPRRTTDELLADLMRDRSPISAHRAELAEFLRHCDLAKFAGWSLSPAQMTAMLTSAEALVRATAAPAPAPTAATTPATALPGEGAA
jgi:hypothetical protein